MRPGPRASGVRAVGGTLPVYRTTPGAARTVHTMSDPQKKDPAQHDVDEHLDPAAVHGDSPDPIDPHGGSAADDAAKKGAVDQLDDLMGGFGPGAVT